MTCENNLNIGALSGGKADTNGLFELLMRAIRSQLVEEYNAGRLTGDDYTKAVESGIAAALQSAVSYLVQGPAADMQALLIKEQIKTQEFQSELVAAQVRNTNAQTQAVCAGICLTNQKIVTEKAQTMDAVDGTDVTGVMGAQMEVYHNQAEGYLRDAEQKAFKMMSDMCVMRVSAGDEDFNVAEAGYSEANVHTTLAKVLDGIGVTNIS